MSTTSHLELAEDQLLEPIQNTIDAAEDLNETFIDDAKDKVHRVTEAAKDIYQTAAVKAEETLETSKEYVRRNPVPVVLGAIAFGAALGYMLHSALRKQRFSERYTDEPMRAVRDAFRGALSPVTQRVHDGYEMARDGAGKTMNRLQRMGAQHSCDSLSERVGRIGNNLKFW